MLPSFAFADLLPRGPQLLRPGRVTLSTGWLRGADGGGGRALAEVVIKANGRDAEGGAVASASHKRLLRFGALFDEYAVFATANGWVAAVKVRRKRLHYPRTQSCLPCGVSGGCLVVDA